MKDTFIRHFTRSTISELTRNLQQIRTPGTCILSAVIPIRRRRMDTHLRKEQNQGTRSFAALFWSGEKGTGRLGHPKENTCTQLKFRTEKGIYLSEIFLTMTVEFSLLTKLTRKCGTCKMPFVTRSISQMKFFQKPG